MQTCANYVCSQSVVVGHWLTGAHAAVACCGDRPENGCPRCFFPV